MRLFYTVHSGPDQMSCGGGLGLIFSTEDPNDYDPQKPNDPWKGSDRIDTSVTLPGGNILTLMFEVSYNGTPYFYLFATVSVTSPSGQSLVRGTSPIGQGTIEFTKGQQAITVWKGSTGTLQTDGFRSNAGFAMTVPFDGTSADCYGRWWANWQPV